MPKVINTRKQRADELLRMIEDGPHIGMPYEKLTTEEITRHYQLWAKTWVIHELIDLVPELKSKHGKK